MITAFSRLENQESELLLKAPILVCILIAGADGDIDRKEIKAAITFVTKDKTSYKNLSQYFAELSSDFEDKIKILIQSYPFESTQRTPLIVQELAEVNGLWSKLEPVFAAEFYQMLREVASRTATSSGGWLGLSKVDEQEKKYLALPMLQDPSKINR